MMYEAFAPLYDALMSDVDYERWARYILRIARHNQVVVTRAADCACGTGSLTVALAKSGILMTGADLSADMLRLAEEKARKAGVRIPFVLQDMKQLTLHRPMDAVFCACDGVNYLTEPKDVQAFFQSVHRALRPGGFFCFDVSSYYKLAETLGNRCLGRDDEAISYIWQNHFDENKRVLQMDLTFFVKNSDGMYRRFDETHFQRAYLPDEIMQWLSEAGFQGVEVYGDQTLSKPKPEEARIHFAAIRM